MLRARFDVSFVEEDHDYYPPPNQSESPQALVDFYREFGLDRSSSAQEILAVLNGTKLEWSRRAAIAGTRGEEAREQLRLIEQAELAFADEDSKERYDRALRATPTEEDEATVNWVNRAWTYYFQKDYGPASVAARKARQHDGDDPTAHVVSAWIDLAEQENRRAEEHASEAYVLDELGEDTFDVHEVRGATFYANKKYERAIEAFKRALTRAPEVGKPETYWRLSLAYAALNDFDQAIESCILGLSYDELPNEHTALRLQTSTEKYINFKCGEHFTPVKAIGQLRSMKDKFEKATINAEIKRKILQFILLLIDQAELQISTETEPQPPKSADKPDFPWVALGITILTLIILASFPHAITFLIFLAPAAYVGFYFIRKSNYDQLVNDYEQKKSRYDNDCRRLQEVQSQITRRLSQAV